MRRVSESNRPEYADGFVAIDVRDPPSLRHAIGSRIYKRRSAAEGRATLARRGNPTDADHYHVVPVEGPSEHFAVDHLDAEGVTIGANGYLSMEAWQPKGGRRWG
jgi:hypothetical protein